MKEKLEYEQYAKAKINKNRNLVISACNKGGFTLAQQLEVHEGDNCVNVFLKGAFHIESISGLVEIRNAINQVLNKLGIEEN